jgi:hypothetical protein
MYLATGLHKAAEENHCEVVRTGHKFHIMRKNYPIERLFLAATLSVFMAGCQQADQILPAELSESDGATITIGLSGGSVSVPPTFSLEFPANSLTSATAVAVTKRVSETFPGDGGEPVGQAFDIGPVGTVLAVPATVSLAVDPALLAAAEQVRLSVALLRQDGSVATFPGNYDLTNGVLTADIDELGPVSAVISADAIALLSGDPTALSGGFFPPPPPVGSSGAWLADPGTLLFESECSPEGRQCFSSGLIRVWADDVVIDRMGSEIFLLSPTVTNSFTFSAFDQFGLPTQVTGSITIDGELRSRINSAVTNYQLQSGVNTGSGAIPTVTSVQVVGNVMTIGVTATIGETGGVEDTEFDVAVEYAISGIGTSEMLTVEVEADIDFENSDGSTTTGTVTAHIRLRRE